MSITVTQAAQEKIASLCSESNMIGVEHSSMGADALV